jgi:hypothetical protein
MIEVIIIIMNINTITGLQVKVISDSLLQTRKVKSTPSSIEAFTIILSFIIYEYIRNCKKDIVNQDKATFFL